MRARWNHCRMNRLRWVATIHGPRTVSGTRQVDNIRTGSLAESRPDGGRASDPYAIDHRYEAFGGEP